MSHSQGRQDGSLRTDPPRCASDLGEPWRTLAKLVDLHGQLRKGRGPATSLGFTHPAREFVSCIRSMYPINKISRSGRPARFLHISEARCSGSHRPCSRDSTCTPSPGAACNSNAGRWARSSFARHSPGMCRWEWIFCGHLGCGAALPASKYSVPAAILRGLCRPSAPVLLLLFVGRGPSCLSHSEAGGQVCAGVMFRTRQVVSMPVVEPVAALLEPSSVGFRHDLLRGCPHILATPSLPA